VVWLPLPPPMTRCPHLELDTSRNQLMTYSTNELALFGHSMFDKYNVSSKQNLKTCRAIQCANETIRRTGANSESKSSSHSIGNHG
jgi:hypothetical protein